MIKEKTSDYFKIYQRVFDSYTMHTLINLANKGYFDTLDCPISTGKEADVFRATTKKGDYRALKIYRIETSNFKRMQDYIIGDPRFEVRRGKRALVETWCQKEFRNLSDARAAGVRVPKPHKAMKNVLVMEFIGEAGIAASLLKDVGCRDWKKIIKTIEGYVRKLRAAGLVHADISEFNVMMLRSEPVLIDIGQAVSIKHPKAKEFLMRDLQNIGRLAKKHGVKFDAEKIYNSIV